MKYNRKNLINLFYFSKVRKKMSSSETERESQEIKRKVKITSTDPDEEPKTYVNFYCCKLSLNIIFTLTYVTCAVLLNILNRVVFYTYFNLCNMCRFIKHIKSCSILYLSFQ